MSFDSEREPCSRCGVRADVGCSHRKAAGPPPHAIARQRFEEGQPRPAWKRGEMNGLLSHHQDRIASNLEAAKRSLEPLSRK